jgi:hypothetical protein
MPTGGYDTYCLWKADRNEPALQQFVAVVRDALAENPLNVLLTEQ